MSPENRLANARADLQAAHDALRIADAALSLGVLRDAMSRAYYAAFHAARALVLVHGLEPRTHAGLFHLFNEHVIRPGQLEPRFNLVLTRLQAYRQASDYAYAFVMSPEDVTAEIAAARELVERAQKIVDAAPR